MSSTTIEGPRAFSKKRGAAQLGVSLRTMDRLIKAEKIKAIRVSTRRVVIPSTEIERILQGNEF
jgi:excisionase family DNA binding protein